jgi:hypothetical protein
MLAALDDAQLLHRDLLQADGAGQVVCFAAAFVLARCCCNMPR